MLSRTPLGVAHGLCWTLAWLWYTVVPIRRRVALDGFRAAFPDRAPGPDLRRMLRGLLLGYFELFREMRRPGSIQVEYRGAEDLQAQIASGKGGFLLAGHFGSWDLLGPMTNRDLKLPASTIVKVPKQKAAAELIEQIRRAMTMELLPARGCMQAVYDQSAAGRILVMLLDQRHNSGIDVDFFGRPALTSPALAVAAQKTGLPVFPLYFYRSGVGRHVVELGPALALGGDVAADTAHFQQVYEDLIRQRPHNWLWMHDRWRQPGG